MIDLDEKLEETYNDIGSSFYWEGTLGEDDCEESRADFIKDIKQAFKDAGWAPRKDRVVQIPPVEWHGPDSVQSVAIDDIKTTEASYNPAPEERYGDLLMNGQYWYDRFKKELEDVLDPKVPFHTDDLTTDELLERAKCAAGIE